MGVVRLVVVGAMVEDQVTAGQQGVDGGEVAVGVGNVGKGFADDGGYGGPFGSPLFGGDGRPLIGAANESVEQGVGAHKGVEYDGEVHPDIIPPVPDGHQAQLRLPVACAVEVFPVAAQFFRQVHPGGLFVRNKMPRTEVVLAETLVDVLHTGPGIHLQLPGYRLPRARLPTGRQEQQEGKGYDADFLHYNLTASGRIVFFRLRP